MRRAALAADAAVLDARRRLHAALHQPLIHTEPPRARARSAWRARCRSVDAASEPVASRCDTQRLLLVRDVDGEPTGPKISSRAIVALASTRSKIVGSMK